MSKKPTSNTSSNGSNSISKAFNNQIITKNASTGEYHPIGYTQREIIPAEKKELLSVAKAMNGEAFPTRVRKLFNAECEAAENAIQTGLYVGYRCPEFDYDCIRVHSNHKCFCGHILEEHDKFDGFKK